MSARQGDLGAVHRTLLGLRERPLRRLDGACHQNWWDREVPVASLKTLIVRLYNTGELA